MTNLRGYWNNRYSAAELTRASGTFVHSENANRWFYRTKVRRIREILGDAGVSLAGADVLDVACGTGAFVALWLEMGAARVVGLDISDKAVEMCAARFADSGKCQFHQLNLSSNPPDLDPGRFDFICIFEAIFLLTEQEPFLTGVRNLCSWIKPGGWLLISDQFPEKTVLRHERLTYHARSLYEGVFKDHGVRIIGLFRQTCVFNRHIFPERIQSFVEARCPWTIYLLDQILVHSPVRNRPGMDEVYYCLARKALPAS